MFSKAWNNAIAAMPIAAIAASGLTFAPQPAEAQTSAPTIGQCVAPAVLSEQLKAQGQRTVFEAERSVIINGQNNKPYAAKLINAFTSNPTGSLGYSVKECADSTGKSTGQLQAEVQLTNVKLYDINNVKSIRPETLVSSPREQALNVCKTSSRNTCGYHNDVITDSFNRGVKVVYQGSTSDGRIITVDSKADSRGSISITDANGASTFAFVLEQGTYTNYAQQIGKTIPAGASVAAAAIVSPILK